ncbi:MAG: response regulator transcription factor, partial [Litorilinea sp.]
AATLEQLTAALHAASVGLRVLGPELLPPRVGEFSPDAIESEQTVEPLTPREMDVLQLLAQGLPNKSIARELAVSEHTVKFHMNSILSKLNAQSRTEAVVNAGRAGIIQV